MYFMYSFLYMYLYTYVRIYVFSTILYLKNISIMYVLISVFLWLVGFWTGRKVICSYHFILTALMGCELYLLGIALRTVQLFQAVRNREISSSGTISAATATTVPSYPMYVGSQETIMANIFNELFFSAVRVCGKNSDDMYVCMYVCMFVCIQAGMYVCMYVCIQAGMYVCMFVCMYVCMYTSRYVCMFVCMYTSRYVCMYVCIQAGMYVCSMYVCMYVCIQAGMYVCKQVCMYVCMHVSNAVTNIFLKVNVSYLVKFRS